MKVKWGMMMTDGRGKLGGQVASKNRSGSYVRTKVTPVNPNTSYQSAVRQRLGSLSTEWGNLSEEERLAWNESANSGQWNKTDIFGDARRPTGKNLFTGINLISLDTTQNLLVKVPPKANFAQFDFTSVSVLDNGVITIDVETLEEPTSGTFWQIEATTSVSAGRYYLKNLYRTLGGIFAVQNEDDQLIITNNYRNRLGLLDENDLGKRVGFRIRQVLDGQVTPWVEKSAIVEAAP